MNGPLNISNGAGLLKDAYPAKNQAPQMKKSAMMDAIRKRRKK